MDLPPVGMKKGGQGFDMDYFKQQEKQFGAHSLSDPFA